MDSVRDSGKLKQLLDNSLSYVKGSDALQIESLEIRSPARFKLKGIGEVIREIREFVKDVSYRMRLEKREKELEREHKKAVYELELAIKKTRLIDDQVFKWDMVHHANASAAFVPQWYPNACFGYDLFVAGYIAWRIKDWNAALAPDAAFI